ncbi:hypothetical protein [Desulfobacter latus]|uniref:Cytoplasmic protein n=1 Tax=Desulfobacter latus TaxID=2292 RepID=A0A850T2Y4_9BACT|nr:hypothetical protein [Desulfobacter latus]NWH05461.1 hypothetical protein [Desulfobacter latus]
MLKNDLILRSPAEKIIGAENITNGQFGAVLSRAGVGKTRFLIQIALTRLLCDEKVLHISLCDTIEKITIRYNEGYTSLVDSIGYVDAQIAERLWDEIQHHKTGIAYNQSTFNVNKIRDYLDSIKGADLSLPTLMIIDGLDFDSDLSDALSELKQLQQDFGLCTWFSMKIHREDPLNHNGYPIQLENYDMLFDRAVFLVPMENKIQAITLKDGDRTDQKFLLNSASLMPVEE